MINVYIYDVNDFPSDLDLSNLPKNIIEHISGYNELAKKQSSIAWLKLFENTFTHFKKTSLNIFFNEYGKPLSNELFFSISHSHDLVVVAIATVQIGIDVERIVNKPHSKALIEFLGLDDNFTELDFIKSWTQYEAMVKYIGESVFTKPNTSDIVTKTYPLKDKSESDYYLSVVTKKEHPIKIIQK